MELSIFLMFLPAMIRGGATCCLAADIPYIFSFVSNNNCLIPSAYIIIDLKPGSGVCYVLVIGSYYTNLVLGSYIVQMA